MKLGLLSVLGVATGETSVMLVNGARGIDEQCLVVSQGQLNVDGTPLVLDKCLNALAVNDGRGAWTLLSTGQYMNVISKKCIKAQSGRAVLGQCDPNADILQLNARNQLQNENHECLIQTGGEAGMEDVLYQVEGAATYTGSHPLGLATNGVEDEYWASKRNPSVEVLTWNLESPRLIEKLEIFFSLPASQFSVAVGSNGAFKTCYEARANNQYNLAVNCGEMGDTVQVKLIKAHPFLSVFAREGGDSVRYFGIRSIKAWAHKGDSVFATCTNAQDGSDKFFMSYISQFDPTANKQMWTELDRYRKAKATLETKLIELSEKKAANRGQTQSWLELMAAAADADIQFTPNTEGDADALQAALYGMLNLQKDDLPQSVRAILEAK